MHVAVAVRELVNSCGSIGKVQVNLFFVFGHFSVGVLQLLAKLVLSFEVAIVVAAQ